MAQGNVDRAAHSFELADRQPQMCLSLVQLAAAISQQTRFAEADSLLAQAQTIQERALSAAYPNEYPAYARRVARLVPGWRA